MRTLAAAVMALSVGSAVPAQADTWTTYRIPESGTSVDIPISIFTEPAGKPAGSGQKFRPPDGSAEILYL